MKKIVFVILIFLFPIYIKADYSIENYYVDITVLENGDVNVKEAFSMSGIYNGIERIVDYKDNYNSYYGSKIASVDDISLYDADEIILNEIRSIDFSVDFKNILINSNLFYETKEPTKGDYGVYKVTENLNNNSYVIYNPSKMNKDFYIDYTLTNMVIKHEDINELAMFFENKENIDYVEMYIHIPNNKERLNVWSHNNARSEIIDKNTIKITSHNFDSSLDFRVIFDKDIVDTKKKSNIEALVEILNIESNFVLDQNDEEKKIKEQAYKSVLKVANTLDYNDFEMAKSVVNQLNDEDLKTDLLVKLINIESKVERRQIVSKVLYSSIMGIIIISIFIIIYQIYKNNDKTEEMKSTNYIPYDYSPTTLSYLLKRRISNKDLTSSILNLINENNISFEQTKNKKDYRFIKKSTDNLSISNDKLVKLIFDNENEITLSKLSKKVEKDYDEFITQYSNWINYSTVEANDEQFYVDLLFTKIFGICYSIVGIVFGALFLKKETYFSPIILIIFCFISILYFILISRKTEKGKIHYSNWKKLKKDILNIDTLPNINIWNKYVIYSIPLGCINKIYKKIKINNMDIKNYEVLIDNYKIIDKSMKLIIDKAYYYKKK